MELTRKCSDCGGTGHKAVKVRGDKARIYIRTVSCPRCSASGRIRLSWT